MLDVKCEIEIPQRLEENKKSDKTKDSSLTVGDLFVLHCRGDWPPLNVESLELRLDPKDEYKLFLIKSEKISEQQFDFLMTSYRTGSHQLKAVQLVDAEHSVVLGDVNFEIKSVIEAQEAEPYGPQGPFVLSLPWHYWNSLLFLFLLLGFVILYKFQKRRRRKRLMKELFSKVSALTPYYEFNQKIRRLQRVVTQPKEINNPGIKTEDSIQLLQQWVADVQEAYILFLACQLNLPLHTYPLASIPKLVQKEHKDLYKNHGEKLKSLLMEFEKVKMTVIKSPAQGLSSSSVTGSFTSYDLLFKDLLQLMSLSRQSVENINQWFLKEEKNKKKGRG